jgi:hypothetical protein
MINDEFHALLAPLHAEDFGLASTHLSERAPMRVCLIVGEGSTSVVELRRLDPCTTPADRLAQVRDECDEAQLGEIVDELVTEIDRYGSSLMLAAWLGTTGRSWAVERRPALAIAIEVAARLNVRDVDLVIVDVLGDEDAHPLVRRVAAQCARHVQFRDHATRCAAWRGLRRALDAWLEEDAYLLAAPAIPSAVLGDADAVMWLLDVVARRPPAAAHAAALGLLDLLSGTTSPRVVVADRERDQVVRTALKRFSESGTTTALAGSLIWLTGAAATSATLSEAIEGIHQAFTAGVGDAPAGAVAAGRLLLQGPLSGEASRQFAMAMAPETDVSQRFWALVHRPRPQWRS